MKIKNTTSFPTEFVRRAASWVCKELDLSQRKLSLQVGRKTRSHWSGLCYGNRVIVNVHPRITTTAQIIGMVEGLGHELFHTVQYREGLWGHGRRGKNIEPAAEAWGKLILNRFLVQREALIQTWSPVESVPPTPRFPEAYGEEY